MTEGDAKQAVEGLPDLEGVSPTGQRHFFILIITVWWKFQNTERTKTHQKISCAFFNSKQFLDIIYAASSHLPAE